MPNAENPLLAWKYVDESVSSELSRMSHHCHYYKSKSVTPTESPISHSESAISISKWDEHLPLPIHDWEIPYSIIPPHRKRDKSHQPYIKWEAPLTSWEAPPTNAL